MSRKWRVYLAGTMRTDWRVRVRAAFPDWPVELLEPTPKKDVDRTARAWPVRDVMLLRDSDVVFAYLDPKSRGIGVAFEVGYAAALGTPVILVMEGLSTTAMELLASCATRWCVDLEFGITILKETLR